MNVSSTAEGAGALNEVAGSTNEGALSSALRARLGCLHADFLGLSSEERQHCVQVQAQGALGQEVDVLAHIDPEKRALFDAQARADSGPQHMAGFFCAIRFGAKGTSTLKLVEAKRLGRLPCFIAGPKATVIEDHVR